MNNIKKKIAKLHRVKKEIDALHRVRVPSVNLSDRITGSWIYHVQWCYKCFDDRDVSFDTCYNHPSGNGWTYQGNGNFVFECSKNAMLFTLKWS